MNVQPTSVFIAGASRGIGAGFARALAQRSSVERLFVAARQPGDSDAIAALRDTHGDCIVPVTMDIADPDSVAAAAATVAEQSDRLDWVLNTIGLLHAGDMQPERRLEDVDAGNIQRSFAVNAVGPLLLVKHLAPLLPRREPCTVATLSARVGSISDNRLGGWYAYRAAKAAQNMLTKTLSIELARRYRKVRCVALHPGTVATDLSAPFRGNVSDDKLFDVAQSVNYLLTVLDQLDDDDNGKFFAWDGQEIPW
ncbi:MAG: SDR family NAD(P)-dependent oxidoreductase [Pseudomonadota bacterium]